MTNQYDGDEPNLFTRLLMKGTKYFLITLAVFFSLALLFGTPNTFFNVIFLTIVWGLGIVIYRRRRGLREWSQSEVPLKDYILTKRQAEESKTRTEREKALDTKDVVGLSDKEDSKWNDIVESFFDEDNTYDKKKPRRKKGE